MPPPTDTGLTLKVSILKGRNLAAKDRSGTSDPYLVLNLGDAKAITHSVPKTLNPEWNASEDLPVNSVQNLLLDVICWDKDRFGKDYMGEFDLGLEEIFADGKTVQEPKWYPLRSKKPGKKTGVVSGEVQLQFTLYDTTNPDATADLIFEKLNGLIRSVAEPASQNATPSMTPSQGGSRSPKLGPTRAPLSGDNGAQEEGLDEDEDEYDEDDEEDEIDDAEDSSKPEAIERRRRRLRIKKLRRKRKHAYEFSGESDVQGIVFLEIGKITDLPPESNLTRTSFDMDPFVVASLGKKTYRTRRVRHSLNPVFNEKMIFQVLPHEQSYSFAFTVIDHDKYSGNDFVASCTLPVQGMIDRAPQANPNTGLYDLQELPEYEGAEQRPRFRKLGMSRSSSARSLSRLMRQPIVKSPSEAATSTTTTPALPVTPAGSTPAISVTHADSAPELSTSAPRDTYFHGHPGTAAETPETAAAEPDTSDFYEFSLPLKMKNLDKWEDKHNPVLSLRAKYMPYPALRQQFWRAMIKQYDADESGLISKVELTTMLDTLGSTLSESTIDSFFRRFPHRIDEEGHEQDLTVDEVVICLEEQLQERRKQPRPGLGDRAKGLLNVHRDGEGFESSSDTSSGGASPAEPAGFPATQDGSGPTSTIIVPEMTSPGDDGSEEHVIEIRECPICHQPRLNKRSDTDIITHIATCASQDWRQVNKLMMGGFVTASQAQRKWYSKVITKISYGGYKLGANSANILVQDRITGQINEEKMSVYVRLGIRLLYKGLKSNSMERKQIRKLLKSMSIKQGKKYDDPASKSQIIPFIAFHKLDLSEVLLPVEEFKNFNEFFYRALKPGARPCSAPDNPRIIVSPADCRSVVFNRVNHATNIWIKGREFSIKRLLGDTYSQEVSRYENGALGIFRLAPQDYHRFHIPVDGVMGKPELIAGEYYTVNPMAIRSALDVYGENVRIVVPIDSPQYGRVMVVCVGAMMVGSTVITRREGEEVKRAEELGYFKFGGSTLVLLFEEGKMKFDDDLVNNSNMALETLVRVGMSIGHSPSEPQYKPDMPKPESEVTEAEKRDAKRRIQGNVSGQDSSEDDVTDVPLAAI
ncbi:related to phosphatidylserine decarboxylase [Cephalotrichum gorgonifer]|uniref:Phosphatidylserine decarboxylase proenzyme 2 n=1 Tax=Cephalotrichum gorgonifer TaxID=2041049 RepID=A0AAE8MTE5_9PEZI|nr:related to phosphatidylserine decarboxylase [Cephalotrichum gorgonifer]